MRLRSLLVLIPAIALLTLAPATAAPKKRAAAPPPRPAPRPVVKKKRMFDVSKMEYIPVVR
jgi:hypothetical protein